MTTKIRKAKSYKTYDDLNMSIMNDRTLVCPYCMSKKSFPDFRGCCGEISDHYVWAEVDKDGELVQSCE